MSTNSFYTSIFLLSTIIFHSSSSPSHHVAATGTGGPFASPFSPPTPPLPYPPPPRPPQLCPPPPPPVACPPPPPPQPPLVCPPPPPPVCPPPRPCLNKRLRRDQRTIQKIKKLIQSHPDNDPKNITAHWIGPNPCNYKGFNCAKNPKFNNKSTIISVQFNGYELRAPFKGFIDELSDLSICHANSNRFHGTVPSDIAATKLPFLFELDLSNNNFSGPFPAAVLYATNLTFLDLRFNNFSGSVPQEAFKLQVDVLFLNNNNFSNQLPSDLGSTPALYLTFANNNFTGPIPSSIGQARETLLEVLFLNNQLSGCLPWEIGQLHLARVFDVSQNQLHGPIPTSFACLEQMQILNLAHNRFDGVVPEAVCELPRLRNLTLRDNYFTEVGPRCRVLIREKVLDVSLNCIRDLEGQKSPEECAKFFSEHRSACPDPFQHLPCKAASDGSGRSQRRGVTEVEPVLSATYGALDPYF